MGSTKHIAQKYGYYINARWARARHRSMGTPIHTRPAAGAATTAPARSRELTGCNPGLLTSKQPFGRRTHRKDSRLACCSGIAGSWFLVLAGAARKLPLG